MAKAYVIICGGIVEAVYSDSQNLTYEILDFDNNGARLPEELECMENHYDAIRQICHEIT